jgi:hypothetical protein
MSYIKSASVDKDGNLVIVIRPVENPQVTGKGNKTIYSTKGNRPYEVEGLGELTIGLNAYKSLG